MISALLGRRYLPELDSVCETGWSYTKVRSTRSKVGFFGYSSQLKQVGNTEQ